MMQVGWIFRLGFLLCTRIESMHLPYDQHICVSF